jgi:hypothetical protein
MTTRSEDILYASLTDIDALERLAKIGLDPECIPTETMRPMVAWALDSYFTSGRRQSPSREMLLEVWGQVLEDEEIVLIEEDVEVDIIESAIDNLKDLHAQYQWQNFIKESATDMANAAPTTKVETLTRITNDLFQVSARLQDNSNRADGYTGYLQALADYDTRIAGLGKTRGMTFGIDGVDRHTFGIHEGEQAILASGPKVGKSYFLDRVALHEWINQKHDFVLYTLENTVQMTMNRIICLHLGINPRAWLHGEVAEEKVAQVRAFVADVMPTLPANLHVLAPTRGSRTPQMLVREARMLGVTRMAIDQLTHVEHPDPGRKPRHELFNENVHEFADLIKDGRDPIALLVAHQINREGVKAAAKQGYLEMVHLAESAGVERAPDWVFGLFQSSDERVNRVAKFQTLAARREDIKNWQIQWDPETSRSRTLYELALG